MTFTLRQLRFLTALADAGSFRGGAEAACVTQPTMSSAIKELEHALGVQLVERRAQGAVLTQAGKETVRRAHRILAEADDLAYAVRAAGQPLSGPFRLGVIPTIAPFLLPNIFAGLEERYPQLDLTFREDVTERLYDDLRSGALDAAVIALPSTSPGVGAEAIFADEFLLAAPLDHPLLEKGHITPNDLPPQELLLLSDGHCLRDHVLSMCSESSRRAAPFAATSLQTLLHMAVHGMGVTLVPKLAVDAGATALDGLAVRRFDPPVIGREIGVAWREGSARREEVGLLAEFFAEQFAAPRTKAG